MPSALMMVLSPTTIGFLVAPTRLTATFSAPGVTKPVLIKIRLHPTIIGDDRNFYGIFSSIISSKMTKTDLNTKENLQKQEKASRQSPRCKKTRKSQKKVKKLAFHRSTMAPIMPRWELLVRQEIKSNKSAKYLFIAA
ncbi:hypothetical protein QL285_032839 [Trifolium repens]|nr:hypothetical protein QL285_032839 [Trifolium repens]